MRNGDLKRKNEVQAQIKRGGSERVQSKLAMGQQVGCFLTG